MTSLMHEIQKEMIQMNLFTNRKRLTDLENELMVTKGKDCEKGQLGTLGKSCAHYYI